MCCNDVKCRGCGVCLECEVCSVSDESDVGGVVQAVWADDGALACIVVNGDEDEAGEFAEEMAQVMR